MSNKDLVESETQSISEELKINTQFNYLLTIPGGIRILNILIGLLCIILIAIGFNNDFEEREDIWLSYVSYYGLGYKEERMNHLYLGIISTCCAISIVLLIVLISVKDAEYKYRAWNRFLHLFLAFFLFIGWLSGLIGFLQFRQGCCRVEMLSSERIKYESEGYEKPCLCVVNPHNDPKRSYPILLYQDAPIGLKFEYAIPHHFYGRIVSLVFTLINTVLYIGAFLKC